MHAAGACAAIATAHARHSVERPALLRIRFGQWWPLDCPSRNYAEVSATGKSRPNIKFAAFWCVFLTKIKVDPESWCKNTLH